MNILLTNDDGIHAPGLIAMLKALQSIATVTVVAPDQERSSIGQAITLSRPLFAKTVKVADQFDGVALDGTPTDCVKFGLAEVLKEKPDLVISGINRGPNEGCSAFYSGTVAAAREGVLNGVPSFAISVNHYDHDGDFDVSAKVGVIIAQKIQEHGIPQGTFLNVNVPALPFDQIKDIKFTQQGKTAIHGTFEKRLNQFDQPYYWMSGDHPKVEDDDSIDINALQHDYVTVTPLHCDATDYDFLKSPVWKLT